MSAQRRSAEYDAKKASDASSVISSDEEQAIIKIQIQEESGHQIKYRSCSWQKVSRLITHTPLPFPVLPRQPRLGRAPIRGRLWWVRVYRVSVADASRKPHKQTAALLFSEYICLAILS